MSSVVFRSSVLIFCLLLFNGGSIVLGALPYFYGPAHAFQVLQLAMAAAAFVLTMLLPCFVIAKRGRGEHTETLIFLVIALLDIVASVFTTLRWVQNKLEGDYERVPKRKMLIIIAVATYWAASLVAAIGFLLAMIDACSRAMHRDKYGKSTYDQRAYDQRIPPRQLQTAPSAHPFTTTYMKPAN